jgi:predicted enzyme related to lactoylglutathione lyase
MPNIICHVEIPTTDLKKAEGVYGKFFDWKLNPSDFPSYTMFETGKELDRALSKVDQVKPGEGVMI